MFQLIFFCFLSLFHSFHELSSSFVVDSCHSPSLFITLQSFFTLIGSALAPLRTLLCRLLPDPPTSKRKCLKTHSQLACSFYYLRELNRRLLLRLKSRKFKMIPFDKMKAFANRNKLNALA